MDSDTMAKKNRFREVLSQFRAGKIDVLVCGGGPSGVAAALAF